jgi:hypothetical protein
MSAPHISHLIARAGQTLAGSIFWAFLIAVGAQHVFRLSDDQSMLFIGLPVAIILAVFLWLKIKRGPEGRL